MKQTISIIGATGNMGSALSRSLAKGNNRLLLFGTDADKLQSLRQDILQTTPGADIEISTCAVNTSWESDIVISALPYEAEKEMAEKIKEFVNQKIVISIANPLSATYDSLTTAPGTSAGEELQKLLPHSKVVKAFNNTFAADFAAPVIDGKTTDAFVAGDDEEAVATVSQLVGSVGFRPLVAGPLSASRTLEQMQLLLIQLTMKNNYNWHAGWKVLHN